MTLYVIGIGPGSRDGMTAEAVKIIERCELVVGYTVYADLLRPYFPEKEYVTTGMRQERERVRMACEAAQSRDVALVCSGDSEAYGMAALAYEIGQEFPAIEIVTVPGVTAALSGGALLGSPLTSDFAVISLSDYLTPWETIEKRLLAASEADFVIVLYNPASHARKDYLQRACELVLQKRPAETVCGIARNIGRDGQETRILTLGELRDTQADMFTTVYIGSSATVEIGGKMITYRGYK